MFQPILILGPPSAGKTTLAKLFPNQYSHEDELDWYTCPRKRLVFLDLPSSTNFTLESFQNIKRSLLSRNYNSLHGCFYVIRFGRITEGTFTHFQEFVRQMSFLKPIISLVITKIGSLYQNSDLQREWIEKQRQNDPRFEKMLSSCQNRVLMIENPGLDGFKTQDDLILDSRKRKIGISALGSFIESIDGMVSLKNDFQSIDSDEMNIDEELHEWPDAIGDQLIPLLPRSESGSEIEHMILADIITPIIENLPIHELPLPESANDESKENISKLRECRQKIGQGTKFADVIVQQTKL